MADRTLLVAAAYVALRREVAGREEVLLLLRSGTGYLDGHWALLAGHVDPGESVHEAAVRESAEEAGITVRMEDLAALTVLHRFQRGGGQVEQRADFFFSTRRWAGEPVVREPSKAVAMTWFPLDELPDPVVPHERLVLAALRDGADLPAAISLVS